MQSYNINLKFDSGTGSSSHLVADYFDMLASKGYFPLINISTRVTEKSATTINHIMRKDDLYHIFSGVIKSDVNDCYTTFCIVFNLANRKVSNYKAIYQRNLTKFKSEEFCESLHNAVSSFFSNKFALNSDNFNIVLSEFVKIINDSINEHALLKKISMIKNETLDNLWYSQINY